MCYMLINKTFTFAKNATYQSLIIGEEKIIHINDDFGRR